jgi:hypothetical protein
MQREEWLNKIKELGGKQPIWARPSDSFNEKTQLELLYVYWLEKLPDYQKIRNRVAKDMRQDGWIVKSSSACCEGGYNCAIIKAERPKVKHTCA